jgi:hypothetical protein
MKLVAIVLAVFLVGGLAFRLTESHRAAGARASLRQAARNFIECYRKERSYVHCDPKRSGLFVAQRRPHRFTFISSVEFGPTYSITGSASGRLTRRCDPPGRGCVGGRW